MGLFSGFKRLFNRNVSLLPYQKNDMVSFAKLKNHGIKIGSEAIVDEGFNLVMVHYNKVCDILTPGTYKLNDDTLPHLYMVSKTNARRGPFSNQTIETDAYFLNLKEFDGNPFKTLERVIAYRDNDKVKIKLEGTFSAKIVDARVFMKALCNDYAVISNKKTIKELRSTVGFEVAKALNKKHFKLDDYIFNKEKILQTIEEGVNAHTRTFGVEVFKFEIGDLIIPKKYLTEDQIKGMQKKEPELVDDTIDVVKLVEDRLNSLQKDFGVVYVNEKGENSVKTKTFDDLYEDENTFGQSAQQTSGTKSEERPNNYHQASTTGVSGVLGGEETKIERVSHVNQPDPIILSEQDKEEDVVIDDEFIDNLIDKINKRKKQKKNDRIVEILRNAGALSSTGVDNKKTTKKPTKKCKNCGETISADDKFCKRCGKAIDELIVCQCCGAKNFANAKECCVCKSKL